MIIAVAIVIGFGFLLMAFGVISWIGALAIGHEEHAMDRFLIGLEITMGIIAALAVCAVTGEAVISVLEAW